MTIDAKLQEELRQQYNPDGSVLRNLQLNLLDILIEFDRICRKNNIDYWIEYGTLLGAIRHGGFIPWDDDIDVCVLRKDRKKLIKAINKDLGESYFFIDNVSKEHYSRCSCGRVLSKKVSLTRYLPDPQGELTIRRKDNIWLDIGYQINGKLWMEKTVGYIYGRCFRRRFKVIKDGWKNYLIGSVMYPFAYLLVLMTRAFGRIFYPKCLINDLGTNLDSQRYVNDIFPLREIEFEGHSFKAPKDIDHYLSFIYRSWRTIPEHKETHPIEDITFN